MHPDFNQTDPSRLGEYADVIAEMDFRVGQIVDAVEQAGTADNTLVVFSSDNGTCHIPSFGFGVEPHLLVLKEHRWPAGRGMCPPARSAKSR